MLVAVVLPLVAAPPATAIEGGEEVQAPDWAALLLTREPGVPGLNNKSMCSGSLITPTVVLTSGHCDDPESAWDWAEADPDVVVTGRSDLDGNEGHESEIATSGGKKRIVLHPCFDPAKEMSEAVNCGGQQRLNREFDVALIFLKTSVPLTETMVALAPPGYTPTVGDDLNLHGYGYTHDATRTETRHLRRTPAGVYSYSGDCGGFALACITDGGDPNVEVVRGDSGSPWTLGELGTQFAVHSGGSSPNELAVPVTGDVGTWIRNTAGTISGVPNTIYRDVNTNEAWLLGGDRYRRPIPTGGDYECFVALGVQVIQSQRALISQMPERPADPATCGAGSTVSTALIIDSSGSMTSSDPQNRRIDGGHAYVNAVPADDEIGVVDFDSAARVLSEAVRVGDNRSSLRDAISTINSSGGTNLGAGLSTGCGVLERAAGATRAALFLTDGFGSYSGQAQCFADQGWKVFTFGLGSGSDTATLQQIAAQTGGDHTQLDSATNMVCEFQQVRARIAGEPGQSCEPTGTIEQDQVISFLQEVLAGLASFTFTNTWLGSDIEMTLTTPSGRVIDRNSIESDLQIAVGSSFETITINNPEPGTWQVELFGADIPPGGEPYTFSTLGISDNESVDSDGDGVPDADDVIPNSDMRPTVVIDGIDTGVVNTVLVDGATFNDLIQQAATDARNHGMFVSAVGHLSEGWRSAGLISGRDHGQITRAAARSR